MKVKQTFSVAWVNSDTDKSSGRVQCPSELANQNSGYEPPLEVDTWGYEEQIYEEDLRRIERLFQEADTDGGGGLDMEEFRESMKKILVGVDDEELDIIFMKVDTNCDLTVDWDEYLNYTVLEYTEKDALHRQTRPLYFPKSLKIVPVGHSELIVRLQFNPDQSPQSREADKGGQAGVDKAQPQPGCYLSVSRDGVLNFWSENFNRLRAVSLDHVQRSRGEKIWVTNMVCISNLNLMAISTTGRDLDFFDISASRCDLVFSLTGLKNYVLVMDYWSDGKNGVFSVGDTGGGILVFISSDVNQHGIFSTANIINIGGKCCLPVSALLKNTSKDYQNFRVADLHGDWCCQIQFIPELKAIATCSASEDTAMVLTQVPEPHTKGVKKCAFPLKKGILCFDYSPKFNVLVTGSVDWMVRLWNPCTSKAIAELSGHTSAVTHVVVNVHGDRIISISKDKNVRVWDLKEYGCLQNIHPRSIQMGHFPISDILYNKASDTLVLATDKMGVLHGAEDVRNKEATSHKQPLCCALYNSNFKQVVSGSHDGMVIVWDVLTGEKVMQFVVGNGVEVTAMAFDGPRRRLITGSKDGSIKLWNFNNGALLCELPKLDGSEVTGIVYIKKRIYVTGWSKRVMWFLDLKEDDRIEHRQWKCYHSEDIYCMDAYRNKLLVTASYTGDMVVWNVDSGLAFSRLNSHESPRPLLPIRVFDEPCVRQDTIKTQQGSVGTQHPAAPPRRALASAGKGTSQTHTKPEKRCSSQGTCSASVTMDSADTSSFTENPSEKTNIEKKIKRPSLAVEKVLFLHTRERHPDSAILLTSNADGYICAWSIDPRGGMLAKFKATQHNDAAVCSMSTDLEDQILLTGDTRGYVKIWDISDFWNCTGEGNSLRLPDLIPAYCRVERPITPAFQNETEVLDGWSVSLTPPPLLSSWRCHLKAVTSLEYVDRFQLIVTASLDCNVRLWSIAGKYIGTFGQGLWNVGVTDTLPLPSELKRVGSYQTLKVINEGTRPHWRCAEKVRKLVRQRKQRSQVFALLMGNKEAAAKIEELLPTDPRIAKYSKEQIEETWHQWQVKGEQKSSILGGGYVQKVRYHVPPSFDRKDVCNR
ncbi:WD repeat-containing protein on Y chromosome [Amia ocellicauda]|uniref:WD repeat-containing protein on Y chromosome n=1 Tax=Amia ocellicauda TaxID=2972642 RepID=UPI003464BACE